LYTIERHLLIIEGDLSYTFMVANRDPK
jgi:hypothetical protein